MKHLKLFKTVSDFDLSASNLLEPWVALIEELNSTIYSSVPQISEDDLSNGDYVDLGLPSGTLWATHNLNADSPCELGLFYQWGATTGYNAEEAISHSSWATTPFNGGNSAFSLSLIDSVKSTAIVNNILTALYDAVYHETEGEYRMPTMEEVTELIANTTYEWCTCQYLGENHSTHEVFGCKFTALTNDNTMFIPAHGFCGSTGVANLNIGYLLTSTLNTNNKNFLSFKLSASKLEVATNSRANSYTVRGVVNKNKN